MIGLVQKEKWYEYQDDILRIHEIYDVNSDYTCNEVFLKGEEITNDPKGQEVISYFEMKTKKELYEELMVIAHNLEDSLGYDETNKGLEWGGLVNKLQEFSLEEEEDKYFTLTDSENRTLAIVKKGKDRVSFEKAISKAVIENFVAEEAILNSNFNDLNNPKDIDIMLYFEDGTDHVETITVEPVLMYQ